MERAEGRCGSRDTVRQRPLTFANQLEHTAKYARTPLYLIAAVLFALV